MHRILKFALFAALGVQTSGAATQEYYEFDPFVTTPPVVDARNVLNSGLLFATNGFLRAPYYTFNTVNHTNRGTMQANVGFIFKTMPSGNTVATPANNVVNETGATISVGGNLEIAATNIVNRGTLSSGSSGRVTVSGQTVNSRNGVITAGAFAGESFFFSGIYNDYWGSNRDIIGQGNFFDGFFADSPFHMVTNVVQGSYETNFVSVGGSFPALQQYYRETSDETTQTNYYQAVYIILPTLPDGEVNPRFTNEVEFDGNDGEFASVIVDWYTSVMSPATGEPMDVELSFTDSYARNPNIFFSATFPNTPQGLLPTFQPSNFDISRSRGGSGFPEVPASIPPMPVTNPIRYSAWGATIRANTVQPDTNLLDTASVTNLPGRIEINAGNLNLNNSRIEAENFLSIKGTNHYLGNRIASIVAPFIDVSLASTNGLLTIDGLINSELPIFVGQIKAYSSYWSDTYTQDDLPYEDNYAVLIVDASDIRLGEPTVHGLNLRADNLVINDRVSVQQNLLLDTTSLTISNAGVFNIGSERIVWGASLPRLTSLTNDGTISSSNSIKFMQGSQPNAPEGAPYQWIVNRGNIEVGGLVASADNLLHSGLIKSTFADVDLRFGSAVTSDSDVETVGGFILSGGNLEALNTTFEVGKRMTLAVSGTLNDGGPNAANLWRTGAGFDLPVKPSSGDLLGTTIVATADDFAEVEIRWAGVDGGGFQNNAALRDLWLNGGFGSLYHFIAAGPQNALYVENLALSEEVEADYQYMLEVDPNFTIYFRNLHTVFDGIDTEPSLLSPAEFESNTGGRFRWMGASAAVNLRDARGNIIGSINVDAALRKSSSADSDGDGTANSADEFPFDGPVLQTQIAESGDIQLQWNAAANTTYSLWRTYNLTTWEKVTDVTSGSSNGPLSVQIPALTNGCTFKVSYTP